MPAKPRAPRDPNQLDSLEDSVNMRREGPGVASPGEAKEEVREQPLPAYHNLDKKSVTLTIINH